MQRIYLNGCSLFACMLMCLYIPSVSAQEINLEEFREMVGCGENYFATKKPDEVVSAMQKKSLGNAYRNTLLAAMSPYSPARKEIASYDFNEPKLVGSHIGALIYMSGSERTRAGLNVDKTASNAIRYVQSYYMALAEGGCKITPSLHSWMAEVEFDKFEKHSDVMGFDFNIIDEQQVAMSLCANGSLDEKNRGADKVALWIVSNSRYDKLLSVARSVLQTSSRSGELDVVANVSRKESKSFKFNTDEEAKAFGVLSTLFAASMDDPDFTVRIQARLIFEYYNLLASNSDCQIPKESLQIIETLHANHH